MEITGAIFDFDGTLFDSMQIWKGIKFTFFDEIGLVLTPEDEEAFKGLYLMEALHLAVERFNLNESYQELLARFFEFLKVRYLAEAVPKNDIIPFLDKLQAKGIKMGIATATGEAALIPLLEKFNMSQYFSSIYSTYTVGASKREPKVYDTVLEELGTDKETTWVFEDALYAATTAKNNGYKVVAIYDESEIAQKNLKEISDIYICNYSELNI